MKYLRRALGGTDKTDETPGAGRSKASETGCVSFVSPSPGAECVSDPRSATARVARVYQSCAPRCRLSVWTLACERYPEPIARLRAAERAVDGAWAAVSGAPSDERMVAAFEVSLVDLERALVAMETPVAFAQILSEVES